MGGNSVGPAEVVGSSSKAWRSLVFSLLVPSLAKTTGEADSEGQGLFKVLRQERTDPRPRRFSSESVDVRQQVPEPSQRGRSGGLR